MKVLSGNHYQIVSILQNKKVLEIAGWQEEEKWVDIHEKLIEICIKMKKFFDPIINEIQKKY